MTDNALDICGTDSESAAQGSEDHSSAAQTQSADALTDR